MGRAVYTPRAPRPTGKARDSLSRGAGGVRAAHGPWRGAAGVWLANSPSDPRRCISEKTQAKLFKIIKEISEIKWSKISRTPGI